MANHPLALDSGIVIECKRHRPPHSDTYHSPRITVSLTTDTINSANQLRLETGLASLAAWRLNSFGGQAPRRSGRTSFVIISSRK